MIRTGQVRLYWFYKCAAARIFLKATIIDYRNAHVLLALSGNRDLRIILWNTSSTHTRTHTHTHEELVFLPYPRFNRGHESGRKW